jgi:hypothetical protein
MARIVMRKARENLHLVPLARSLHLVPLARSFCLCLFGKNRTKPFGIRATLRRATGINIMEDVLVPKLRLGNHPAMFPSRSLGIRFEVREYLAMPGSTNPSVAGSLAGSFW